MKKLFICVICIFIFVAIALPVVSLHTLPFTDLPIHLAEATILKYAHNPTNLLAQFYSPNRLYWFQPVIAHAVICSWFPSVEGGNKLLYLLYCLAIPFLMLIMARTCEGNWVLALLSIVTIWNFSALWGFAGFTLGIPLVLLFIFLHIRCITRRSWVDGILISLLFLLLYWFHVLLFLFALFLYIVVEFCNVVLKLTSARQMLVRLTALLPATGMLITWILKGPEVKANYTALFLKEYYFHLYIPNLWGRVIYFLTADWSAIASGYTGATIAVFFAMLLLIPAVACLCCLRRQTVPLTTPRVATMAFVGTAFFCFAFLPSYLSGQPILYERFSVFCYLGIISVLAWALPIYWPRLRYELVVIVAILGYAIMFSQYFWSFRTIDDTFVSFIRTGPDLKGRMVGYLIDEPNFRGRPVLIHYNNYQIVWNQSPTLTTVGKYRFGMIRQIGQLPTYQDLVSCQPSVDIPGIIDQYSTCDYLVAQGKRPNDVINQRRGFVQIHKLGTWCLFKRKNENNVGKESK